MSTKLLFLKYFSYFVNIATQGHSVSPPPLQRVLQACRERASSVPIFKTNHKATSFPTLPLIFGRYNSPFLVQVPNCYFHKGMNVIHVSLFKTHLLNSLCSYFF